MAYAHNEDVEALLSHRGRESLSFGRMLLLYLDPFALFKDAAHGPAMQRYVALRYNRSMRWMLLAYIRRWMAIAGCCWLGVAAGEALSDRLWLLVYPAIVCGACCCLALIVIALAAAVYVLLGLDD
jgi:hypothetical protein